MALKRKAAESKNYSRLNLKNEQGNTTSSQLVESLGIQDLTMVELDTLLSAGNNTALTDSESYNLGCCVQIKTVEIFWIANSNCGTKALDHMMNNAKLKNIYLGI